MRVQDVTAVVSAFCAIVLSGAVVKSRLMRPEPLRRGAQAPAEVIERWRELARTGPSRGEASAEVVVVEFSDFECPYCRELANQLRTVSDSASASVRHVYRHYPLRIHPRAKVAALASECASAQGVFWSYHDSLFATIDELNVRQLVTIAAQVGVQDTADFDLCVRSERYAWRIREDSVAAAGLGISGTPLVIVNGRVIRGLPDPLLLDSLFALARPGR